MKTVLTVDDSKVVRTMVTYALAPYRCRVIEAKDGREGVEAARRERPDLILLDVTMPVMGGREALIELRREPLCRDIPVIMLTAMSGREIQRELTAIGISGYIVKPFKQDVFDQAVSGVLGPRAAFETGYVPLAPHLASGPAQSPATQLVESDGCAVFVVPRAGDAKELLVAFIHAVANLARAGRRRLILDLRELSELDRASLDLLARMISEAGIAGVRLAICSPNVNVIERLRPLAEIRDAPYAVTREAARAHLR